MPISNFTIKYKQIFRTNIRDNVDNCNRMFYTNHQGNTKLNKKDLSNHTNGVDAPLTDRSFHTKHAKNALKLLLHIHDPISSNIRAFSAKFPVVIISTKIYFVGKLLKVNRSIS